MHVGNSFYHALTGEPASQSIHHSKDGTGFYYLSFGIRVLYLAKAYHYVAPHKHLFTGEILHPFLR